MLSTAELFGKAFVPLRCLFFWLSCLQVCFSRYQDDITYNCEDCSLDRHGGRVALQEVLGKVQCNTEAFSLLAHSHLFIVSCAHSLVLLRCVSAQGPCTVENLITVRASKLSLAILLDGVMLGLGD